MSHGSRHLEVIFCDDIREEVGNKFSFMGIYSSELTVPKAPVSLTKLCIVVKVVTDIDDPFEVLDVRVVKVKGNNDEIELLSTGPVSLPTERPGPDTGLTRMAVQMNFILAPFQIDEETKLRIKAITEREELRGVTLRIRIVPPLAAQAVQ